MKRDLAALASERFDVLIVGGGISGAGVALDATLRGLRVALIDKGDFASGTSSLSSKLVHGGLRYLEHGDFHLVYEALHERGRLLRNAAHLVRPLRFIIPFRAGARLSPWKCRLGLGLYDLLAGRGNLQRSRPLHRRELLQSFPDLRGDGLTGGAAYYDAQMDDARLCLAVLRSAAMEGAQLANYLAAAGFERSGSAITGVQAIDRITGQQLVIRARQVVNATGPWLDQVCQLAGEAGSSHLQPSKGVHLVLPARGYDSAFLLLHPADGRVFFVIPWLGKTLLGTTDTFTEAGADDQQATAEDVAYLLAGHNHYFTPVLTESAISGRFVGLRPLLRSRPGEPSSVSREFQLIEAASGLLSLAGGKYTTFRAMAEQATNVLTARLGVRRACRTHNYRLLGTPAGRLQIYETAEVAWLVREYHLLPEQALHLVQRYGTEAGRIADYIRRDPSLSQLVTAGEPELRAEFVYHQEAEMALQPADYLLRRTRLGLFQPGLLETPPWLPAGRSW